MQPPILGKSAFPPLSRRACERIWERGWGEGQETVVPEVFGGFDVVLVVDVPQCSFISSFCLFRLNLDFNRTYDLPFTKRFSVEDSAHPSILQILVQTDCLSLLVQAKAHISIPSILSLRTLRISNSIFTSERRSGMRVVRCSLRSPRQSS